MRYLITGGAGFIGTNFVRRAMNNASLFDLESICVLDKLTYSGTLGGIQEFFGNDNFSFIRGDISDESLLEELLPNIDVIINFAAESHVDRSISDPSVFFDTNIIGVSRLLESVKKFPEKIFVQISTDEVYGSLASGSANESFNLKPNSPYSAAKASADLLIRSYVKTFGLDIRITRCTNNYGPFQYPEKLIPYFISQLVENKPVPIYGNGLNVRDWIHVNDHVEGIRLVVMSGKAGGVYNLGGGTEFTNLEITKQLLDILGKDTSLISYIEDRLGHDYRYSLDFNFASKEIGFSPKVSFQEGLTQTVNWYLENRSWWEPLLKGKNND